MEGTETRAAWAARDAAFDGRFFVGVRTTGIYCRPVCPVRLPLRRNIELLRSAAAAERAGYRPCLRCRPEAAPSSPAWKGTLATVERATRLIEGGALDGGSVERLAARLGVGPRHLSRLCDLRRGLWPSPERDPKAASAAGGRAGRGRRGGPGADPVSSAGRLRPEPEPRMNHLHPETPAAPRGPAALIGAPVEDGTHRGGCLMGPAALRTAGIRAALEELGCAVRDRGDLRPPAGGGAPAPRLRNLPEIASWTRAVAAEVGECLAAGELPVVLGGDHSLSIGSVAGAARHWRARGRELFVLWLDAHADFNTPDTSPSGNMHGMPLAALCGEPGLEAVFDGGGGPRLSPDRLHLFGIRSVDRGERALLSARGVDVVDMRLIDEWGVAVPMRRILERVAAARGVLHVSLDVDFLDPALAPGVGTTVPGGATYREAHLAMEMIHDSGLMGSLDVVELNPFLDERGRSALVLVDLVASLFGRRVMDRATAAGPLF